MIIVREWIVSKSKYFPTYYRKRLILLFGIFPIFYQKTQLSK